MYFTAYLFQETPFMIAIDNTSLAMFKECPQKYKLGIIEGYRRNTKAPPLVFGSIYHDLLEMFDRLLATGISREDALRLLLRQALTYTDTLGELNDDKRNIPSLLRALVWYEMAYRNDPFVTVILPDGRPAVELSFQLTFPMQLYNWESGETEDVIYCGHVDRVVSYNNALYAMEHKHTTSALGDYYYDRYTFSSQISGYAVALRVVWGLDAVGAVIDATAVGVTFTRFGRRIATRVEDHLEEWIEDTRYWINQVYEAKKAQYFPRNTESCSKYNGCQFRDVCFARPGARDTILKADFHVEHWNPMKPRGPEED
jgi:PD-(D/E)XK nuclease superfamily